MYHTVLFEKRKARQNYIKTRPEVRRRHPRARPDHIRQEQREKRQQKRRYGKPTTTLAKATSERQGKTSCTIQGNTRGGKARQDRKRQRQTVQGEAQQSKAKTTPTQSRDKYISANGQLTGAEKNAAELQQALDFSFSLCMCGVEGGMHVCHVCPEESQRHIASMIANPGRARAPLKSLTL